MTDSLSKCQLIKMIQKKETDGVAQSEENDE